MGTVRTVEQLTRQLDTLGKVVKGDTTDTVQAVSQFMKVRALELAAEEVGSDLLFRNNNRRRLGVRYNVNARPDGAQSEVRATGPFGWLEYGVAPHAIVPGGKTKAFRSLIGASGGFGPALPVATAVALGLNRGKGRGRLMVWNGGKAAAFFITKGGAYPAKQTWTHAKEQTSAASGEIADRQLVRSLTKVIR
jgi:hypothetical protein